MHFLMQATRFPISRRVCRALRSVLFLMFLPFVSLLLFSGAVSAADSNLAIVQAGVQQSEDAPFVPNDYVFLPGDYLYFTFQIAGFSIQSLNRDEVRKISLTYQVAPEDMNGVPLTEPVS